MEAMSPRTQHGDASPPIQWTALQREMFRANRASSGSNRPYQTQWHCTIAGRAPVELLTLHLRAFHARHRDVLAARPEGSVTSAATDEIEIDVHEQPASGESLEQAFERL